MPSCLKREYASIGIAVNVPRPFGEFIKSSEEFKKQVNIDSFLMLMYSIDMKNRSVDKIKSLFITLGGYAHMKELKEHNIRSKDISDAVSEGYIDKIKPGLYRLSDLEYPENISLSFIDATKAISKSVICLISALAYYELTTFNPSQIYVAVPNNGYVPKLEMPPIEAFYFRDKFYNCGIDLIESLYGTVKIYSKEKTICDMFRYRNKLGEDIALEGLKNYLSNKNADLLKLKKYAEICEVKTVMTPLLKALVNQNG